VKRSRPVKQIETGRERERAHRANEARSDAMRKGKYCSEHGLICH
jgi:hypothetical protein